MSDRSNRPDFRLAPLRIVLIEDSTFDAELVRRSLSAAYPRAVLDVVTDEDGLLERLVRDDVDIILSDYRLIGLNGADALRLALSAASNAPFIMVSGVIGEENAVEMMKQGATDYVSKSRLARLPVVIERALHEVAERRARGVAESQLRAAGGDAGSDAGSAPRAAEWTVDRAFFVLDVEGAVTSSSGRAGKAFGAVTGATGDPDPSREQLHDALAHGEARNVLRTNHTDRTSTERVSLLMPLYDSRGRHSGFLHTITAPTGTTP